MTTTSPKKILIVNGAATFNGHGGTLNMHYSEFAAEVLRGLGHSVEVTTVDRDFDPAEEAAKVVEADAIIMQFAGWWMGQPWQVKRWEDLVFTRPEIGSGDGRSRTDRTALYGTGGRNTQKTYMLSSTWNAPLEAFNEPMQFFEAKGIDGLLFPMHKTFEFLGMRPLPSFIANDVLKNPTIEADLERFKAHLIRCFG